MSGRDGGTYTTPILEKPSYRNSGIIKAVTASGEKIQVARIDYESFENEEFQYHFSVLGYYRCTVAKKYFRVQGPLIAGAAVWNIIIGGKRPGIYNGTDAEESREVMGAA